MIEEISERDYIRMRIRQAKEPKKQVKILSDELVLTKDDVVRNGFFTDDELKKYKLDKPHKRKVTL